jgi:hypothetical protein
LALCRIPEASWSTSSIGTTMHHHSGLRWLTS